MAATHEMEVNAATQAKALAAIATLESELEAELALRKEEADAAAGRCRLTVTPGCPQTLNPKP